MFSLLALYEETYGFYVISVRKLVHDADSFQNIIVLCQHCGIASECLRITRDIDDSRRSQGGQSTTHGLCSRARRIQDHLVHLPYELRQTLAAAISSRNSNKKMAIFLYLMSEPCSGQRIFLCVEVPPEV
jgi:hypothetical protein